MSDWPYSIQPGQTFPVPPDFDPNDQPIWFLLKNGTVARPFFFGGPMELDYTFMYNSEWCVVYGVTIGAAVMTLLHVLALTPITKRRTLIYWLNIIGLCQVIVRGIFQSITFTRDSWNTGYVLFTGDTTRVPMLDRVHQAICTILAITTIAMVQLIFYIQGRAILSSLSHKLYLALMTILIAAGVAAVAMRTIKAVYDMQDVFAWDIPPGITLVPGWAEPGTLISYVVSIGAWSFVWSCFIGRQIYLRWKMNIMRGKTFGAMNVLFLAGIQSMVIPIFLLVMQFVPYEKSFIGAEYLVIPTVLCLMPFSCLWAGTISSAGGGGSEEPTRSRHTSGAGTMSKLPFAKYFSSAHSTSQVNSRTLSGATATSHPHTPRTTQGVSNHIDKLYPELRSEDHIAVTQTYSVHSDASSRHGSTVQERGGSENV